MLGMRALPLGVLFVLNIYARPCLARTFFNDSALQKRSVISEVDLPACQIYCYGPLLHTVQKAQLFQDSKTFVDMKLKFSPEQTSKDFDIFMEKTSNNPSEDELRDFVKIHFDELGKEFVPFLPTDWKDHPKFLDGIKDPDLKQWGSDLNGIWKDLGRKMIDDVFKNPEYYSIIPVENPVIIPGGRFIEFYYWDSYWIIRGLLISEMYSTARGMIENFLSIVQRFGFIPNGGRIYYAKRSQPPLLPSMIKSYADFTNDTQFALSTLNILEHEFEYWMNNHTIQAKGFNMATYGDSSYSGPRPESYREDVDSAKMFLTDQEKEEYYSQLKAAAESGMDFTSRWIINDKGTIEGNITNLKTRSIVPVELNAMLYSNAKIIAELHMKAGNTAKKNEYENKARRILEGIEAVHWNEKVGAWLDYDLINKKQRDFFVTSNLSPLWCHAYNITNSKKISAAVLKYIERHELDKYPGGVPNTLYRTGEQWDYPNVWAPMQYILIEGLQNLGTPEALNLSKKWGHRWVKSNFEAYRNSRAMFEKYDAERFGGYGGGGEYDVQKGFGWTNGVILEYLVKYGQEITLSNGSNSPVAFSKFNILGVAVVAIMVLWTKIGSHFT